MGIVPDDMRANEIVAVTRGSLHIALALMKEAMARDYYHTTAAAAEEIDHVLADKK